MRLILFLALTGLFGLGDLIPGKGNPRSEGAGSRKCEGCCPRCHGDSRTTSGGTGSCNQCGGYGHMQGCAAR